MRAMPAVAGNLTTSFAVIALLGGWLGPAGLGKYLFAVGVIHIACIAGGLGLPSAGSRLLPLYEKDGERRLFNGFSQFSGVLVAATSGFLGLLLYLGAHFHLGSDASLPQIWWIATLVSLGLLLNGIFRSLGRVWLATLPQGSFRNLSTLGVAGLYLLLVQELTSSFAIWAFGVSALLAVAAQLYAVSRHRRNLFSAESEYRPREWLTAGLQYYPMDLARVVATHGTTIAIRLLDGAEAAGYFGAVSALVLFLMLPIRSGLINGQRYFPVAFRTGGLQALNPLVIKLEVLGLAVSVPIYLTFSLFPHFFMSLIGENFHDAAILIPILGAAFLISGLTMIRSSALIMTPHLDFVRKAIISSEFLLIIAVSACASLYGMVAIAWAMLSVSLIRFFSIHFYWYKTLSSEKKALGSRQN